jgi:hypothetical protein
MSRNSILLRISFACLGCLPGLSAPGLRVRVPIRPDDSSEFSALSDRVRPGVAPGKVHPALSAVGPPAVCAHRLFANRALRLLGLGVIRTFVIAPFRKPVETWTLHTIRRINVILWPTVASFYVRPKHMNALQNDASSPINTNSSNTNSSNV